MPACGGVPERGADIHLAGLACFLFGLLFGSQDDLRFLCTARLGLCGLDHRSRCTSLPGHRLGNGLGCSRQDGKRQGDGGRHCAGGQAFELKPDHDGSLGWQ